MLPSLTFFIITNLIHKFLVHSHKLHEIKFHYMFRAQSAHHQEANDANCTYAASGIVTLCKWPSCATAKEGLVMLWCMANQCQELPSLLYWLRSYVTPREKGNSFDRIISNSIDIFFCLFLQPRTAALRLIVRSWLGVPTFATRRLHACRHARTPSGGRWNCGREMSGNFA